jgi:hypothetical protein
MALDLEDPETKAAIAAAAQEAAKSLIESEHAGLIAKRDELLGINKTLKENLKTFDGVDADQFRSMQSEAEKAEEDKLRANKDFDTILSNQQTKLQGVIGDKDASIEKLKGQLHKEKITTVATRALAEAKGSPELLMPHLTNRLSLDDDMAVVVNDKAGGRMFNGQGEPATISDLVDEMKNDPIMSRAFDAGVKSGTGARSSGNSGAAGAGATTAGNPFVRDKDGRWNAFDGMKLVKENPDEARRLADEAGEKIVGVNA